MDIIDYLILSLFNHEFIETLNMLFGEETVLTAKNFGIIQVNNQVASLTIH